MSTSSPGPSARGGFSRGGPWGRGCEDVAKGYKMEEGLLRSSRKTPTKFDHGYEPSFENDGTPSCLTWSIDDVADWIEYLGFKQYRGCFSENLVNGRRLVTVDASSLSRMGITDFEHIKVIAKSTREALGIEQPYWNRSISLKHRGQLGLFLERKSKTGVEADILTFREFIRQEEKLERGKVKTSTI